MLENFQGDSWGSIPPLRMPSLLPHDLCHGQSSSCWLPARWMWEFFDSLHDISKVQSFAEWKEGSGPTHNNCIPIVFQEHNKSSDCIFTEAQRRRSPQVNGGRQGAFPMSASPQLSQLKILDMPRWPILRTSILLVVAVQSLSHVQLFVTPWTAVCQASVLHYLSEFAQIHVHGVGDAIQPSHSLSSPSPPAFNLSQPEGLFQWVGTFTNIW